jgi:Domain of unknown function (DUF4145)
MALLVSDCPRCGSNQITFDVMAQVYDGYTRYNFQHWYEIFCVCRACSRPTIFLVYRSANHSPEGVFDKPDALVKFPDALNQYFEIERFISLRDNVTQKPPEHLPKEIENAFTEGAACLSIGCNNAAATMFRLCVDVATRPLLPDPADTMKAQPPNNRTRRDLGLRLGWMFDNGILPSALKELAQCIREDGNDGAHAGNLTKEDAEDLLDFTTVLLERLITEPKRLALAEERRKARRTS